MTHRPRVALLAGQTFALGLTLSWILVPGGAIFLDAYGSNLLPVTYIGAGVAGVAASAGLTAALRRRPVSFVAASVLAGVTAMLLVSWMVLTLFDAPWVSFGLLVLFPIGIPIGFMLVVSQAGLLLDVRELKSLYGRIVAGFALGFVTGSLAGPVLLKVLPGTQDLLAFAAAAGAALFALIVATRLKFPTELATIEHEHSDEPHPTIGTLLRNRYVVLIIAVQMLSALESQLLDYLVFERAASRYSGNELADFIGRFTAIAYGMEILFLLILAGFLLRHFGLRYGLTAGPVGVLGIVIAVLAAGTVQGAGATPVFVLIVAARCVDLTLGDGATRTSISAAYQAVPSRLRLATQTTVEGLGVPLAIGFSGVVLLVVQATVGTQDLALPALTSLVLATGVAVGALLYRGYRDNLIANLRHRELDLTELTIDDTNSLVAIDRLLASPEARDVRLGLDALAVAEHPALPDRLLHLASDNRPVVATDALARLVAYDQHLAVGAARDDLNHPSTQVRAASVRTIGAARSRDDLPAVEAHANDPSREVRIAVAAAMSHIGDANARRRVGDEIAVLASSPAPPDRIIAAEMLAATDSVDEIDRDVLTQLVRDDELDVLTAALAALRWPEDGARFDDVVTALRDRHTASTAVDALVRAGPPVLTRIDAALADQHLGRRANELLARACRLIGGDEAADVLRRHVDHPDREVGLEIMTALGTLVAPDPNADPPIEAPDVVVADLEHAAHVLRALVTFDDNPSAELLCAALNDELELMRNRVLAGLSTSYGAEAVYKVAFQFAQHDARSHALALEWLDISLTGASRAAVGLLEPGLSRDDRTRRLDRQFRLAPLTPTEILMELFEDRDDRWRRPWIQACALDAAARLADFDLDALEAPDDADGIVHETLVGLRERRAMMG